MHSTLEEVNAFCAWLRSHLAHVHLYPMSGLEGLVLGELQDIHQQLHQQQEQKAS